MENFEDWKKRNPNGSLNEWYRQNPQRVESITPQITTSYDPPIKHENFYQSMVVGISVALLGFIGYFSPWFTIPVFHISISGNDLKGMFSFLARFDNLNVDASYLKFIYIVPVSYIIIFVGSLAKSYLLSYLGSFLNILGAGVILFRLGMHFSELETMIGWGLYLIAASYLTLLYHVFSLKYR